MQNLVIIIGQGLVVLMFYLLFVAVNLAIALGCVRMVRAMTQPSFRGRHRDPRG